MWAFWLLFAVVAVLLLLYMAKVERGRSQARASELQAAAEKMGASYSPEPPPALLAKLEGFDLTYSDGARLPQSVRDVFAKKNPAGELYVFLHEHRGSLPGDAAGGAHRETVGCVVSPRLRLPRFRLGPERSLEKIASVLGMRDVDFASHPGFSRAYYLNTQDEAAVRRLFAPTLLDFFESNPGWQVEGRGDTLVVYRFKRTLAAAELAAFLKTVQDISSLFPAKLSAG